MNQDNLFSEFDWDMFVSRDPATDQGAWNYGTQLIDDFFAPGADFWNETDINGRFIASDVHAEFDGQAGNIVNTGDGSGSNSKQNSEQNVEHNSDQNSEQSINGVDFTSSEVHDAVVSTNQQSTTSASLDPLLTSPSVVVNKAELPSTERAQIRNMSDPLPSFDFSGGHHSDLAMTDSPQLPVRVATPLFVGREDAQTLQYGTDGTAGRTPHGAQYHTPHALRPSPYVIPQTLRTTPSMAAAAALYNSSSPYSRGRHTQSTDGAESLRRDMEQPTIVRPAKAGAIPFPGLKTQDAISSAQETTEDDEPANTPAKITKTRTSKRNPKANIENQMYAVLTTSDNGSPIERLAKGSELGFKSPAPKATKKRKAQPEPMKQALSGATAQPSPALSEKNNAKRPRNSVSSREVCLLTGVEVNEDNKRKTRSSAKAGEAEAGPDAGKAVPTPPTTGRSRPKRARRAVDSSDVDETSIKKVKGKGKGKGKEVAGLTVPSSPVNEPEEEEPEEEGLGEEELEELGDEWVYDPEGEALGEGEEEEEHAASSARW